MPSIKFDGALPLEGVQIAEISCGLAGVLTGRLLGEQGASIVRIRLPEAQESDLAIHRILDKDKSILDLDPGSEEDLSKIITEIERADVLIDAQSDAIRPLRVEQELAIRERDSLVHLVITGFPEKDAEHRNVPAWEGVLNAACGLYSDVNLVRSFLGLNPVYSALPHCSVYGAVHGALAVTLALLPNQSGTRLGQRIEIPLASAGLSAMSSAIMRIPRQPRRYDVPRIPRWLQRSVLPALRMALSRSPVLLQAMAARVARRLTPPMMNHYACRDGALLYIFAMDHDRMPLQLLRHLDLADCVFDAGLKDEDAYAEATAGANIRESANLSGSWRRRIGRLLAEKFRERNGSDWEDDLMAAGLPCAVVRSTRQWLQLPELQKHGILERVRSEGGTASLSFGRQAWVRRGQGNHNTTTPERRRGESLLSGIRVVDFSNMIAGPVCARTLAEYGAEVIKVISPRPHHGPRMVCWYGIDVDQGKRSILLDLRSKIGQEVLRKLLRTTDIVVHNFTSSSAQKLGLALEDVANANPAVVVCRIGAFLGPSEGPWSERHGYDPVLQAASGVMVRYGDMRRPEHHGIASCIDYLTGFSGALAAALGLVARSRSGQSGPCLAETSLAQSANLIQAPFALDPAPADEPRGQRAMGDHALHRLYRTRDGWIFLAAPPGELEKIAATIHAVLPDRPDVRDSQIERAFERAIKRLKTHHLKQRLATGGVAVWALETLGARHGRWIGALRPGEAMPDGPMAQILRVQHPAGGQVDTLAPVYARLSSNPLRVLAPAPKPGTHTREILAELGYDAPSVARMISSGSATDQLSTAYLPP